MEDRSLVWVYEVAAALEARLKIDGTPHADIEWLLLRCRDTLGFAGELQLASTRQLVLDVWAFMREFPDELPRGIVPERAE
jgi:hypothetical protein